MLRQLWSATSRLRTPSTSRSSVAGKGSIRSPFTSKKATFVKSLVSQFTPSISSSIASLTASHHRISIRKASFPLFRTYSTAPKVYEKEGECKQRSSSLLVALSSPNVDLDKQLHALEQFITDFPEEQAQKHLTMVLDQWISEKFEMPISHRLRAVELGILYYCEAELLIKAEALYYKVRSQYKCKGSALIYETLLVRSGRHKQRPSIELAFKSWKQDFGLSYSYQPSEPSPDLTPRQGHLRNSSQFDSFDSEPIQNFFEYIKNEENHGIIVTNLFISTMKAATKAKSLDFAVSVFEESLLVIKQNKPLYEAMIECFCKSNRVENGYKLIYSMPKLETISSIDIVLEACARLGNYHLSERLFNDIRRTFNMTPTIISWNHLLKVYVLREEMQIAHLRFLDMLQTKERTRPNLETYEMMVAGHVRSKDSSRALEMLKHAKSNKINPSPLLYAWVMEGHLHAKQYDEMFAIIYEMQEHKMALPHKFQNLLIRKCRRVDGLLERYEAIFGPAPEPFDDLKEIREHVEAARLYHEENKKNLKLKKIAAKKTGGDVLASEKKENNQLEEISSNEDNVIVEDGVEDIQKIENELSDIPIEEGIDTSDGHVGMLEEVIEDDTEMSKEEWMKDDIGKDGWKDFSFVKDKESTSSSSSTTSTIKKKKSKLAHMVNLRYKDVFEVAKWKDPKDLDGSVTVSDWQIMSDPFSKTRPHIIEKRKVLERAAAQIETIQQEVIEKIDAQTIREKLKQQRRRERAYGQTRKYIDDPKKLRMRAKQEETIPKPPVGSTFSFR